MADIDDLGYKSISEMTPDEAIEYLRQVRLSRRVPVKSRKASKAKSTKAKKAAVPKPTKSQASNLLKQLEDLL